MNSPGNGKLLGILAHVEALLLCSMTSLGFESSPRMLLLVPVPLLLPPAFSSSEHPQFPACTLVWQLSIAGLAGSHGSMTPQDAST